MGLIAIFCGIVVVIGILGMSGGSGSDQKSDYAWPPPKPRRCPACKGRGTVGGGNAGSPQICSCRDDPRYEHWVL